MFLNRAVGEYVSNGHTILAQNARYKYCPMAIKGFLLSAHECDMIFVGPSFDSINSFAEEVSFCEQVILNLAIAVAASIFGSGTKFLAKEDVFNGGAS